MLTVLISAETRDAAALQATLSPLVPAALDGLVRDVVVVASDDTQIHALAEHAGCRVVPSSGLAEACAGARGDWFLCLEAGCELMDGWIDAVWRHVGTGSTDPARFTVAAGPLHRLRALARPRLHRGVMAPRAVLSRVLAGGRDLEAVAGHMRTRPVAARIRLPPR